MVLLEDDFSRVGDGPMFPVRLRQRHLPILRAKRRYVSLLAQGIPRCGLEARLSLAVAKCVVVFDSCPDCTMHMTNA